MADKQKILSQGKLEKLVTSDANERSVAPSRATECVNGFETTSAWNSTLRLRAD